MEIEYTNEMLAEVLEDAFNNLDIDSIETISINISTDGEIKSHTFVITTKTAKQEEEDFNIKTGDKVKISFG